MWEEKSHLWINLLHLLIQTWLHAASEAAWMAGCTDVCVYAPGCHALGLGFSSISLGNES